MTKLSDGLPLLPLDDVLFPYATMRLHIGDSSCKLLIHECQQQRLAIGVVLSRSQASSHGKTATYLVGTAGLIASVESYPDGGMNVVIRGGKRFRIRSINESGSHLVGHTEAVMESELEDSPRAIALTSRLRECADQFVISYLQQIDAPREEVHLPEDPVALSFVIANFLRIENLAKQLLLETTDTLERIAELIPILQEHTSELLEPGYFKLTSDMFSEWVSPN